MKKLTLSSIILVIGSLIMSTSIHAELINIEEAIETETFTLSMDKESEGTLIARQCIACAKITLKVDRNTLVTKQGKTVEIKKVLKRMNNVGATIIYNVKNNTVTQIIL